MNLRKTLLSASLFVLAFAGAAGAQTSVYGTVSVEHITGIQCLQTVCGSGDGTINPLGGFGGVFRDVKTLGPVRLGVDLRVGSTVGNKNAATYFNTARPRVFTALAGVRGSFGTPLPRLRPYIEGAVGYAKSNVGVPEQPASPLVPGSGMVKYDSGIQFRGFAGVDLAIAPAFDFRVVELGAGGLHSNNSTYPIESISTGVVFHLPF